MKKINNLFKLIFMTIIILTFCGCSDEKVIFEIILETNIDSGYEWKSTESDNVNLLSNMNMMDDDNLDNVTQLQIQEAWQHLMEYELENNDYSILDNENVQQLLSR